MIKKLICGCFAILLSLSLTIAPFAAPSVSGSSGVTSRELLCMGERTGVTYTQMTLPVGGTYNPSSRDKVVCMAEADLSNTRLSVDVINCGSYAVSAKRVTAAIADYNAANAGKTVLAAMNGDLWMTAVNSNSGITKSLLKVPRGVMMVDREIWASQEIGMENASLSSGTPTTHTIPKAAFGVTSQNQPIVGVPWIYPTLKNETTGEEISVDGINRLPANDSVILYNHRCYTTNYALNDAFEIELEAENTAFTLSGSVVGRVKAIYPSGSTTRPSIGENTVLITARGSGVNRVVSLFSVGDVVSVRCEVEDTFGNNELWRDAVSVIGGHILLKAEDRIYTPITGTSEYPVSLIGIKDDGKVLFCSITAASDGVRLGVNNATVHALVEELGYNSVFFLDGGGSTTFVTLEEGSYTVRSRSSDGSPRAVINAVALVWNNSPICEQQGSLSYIRAQSDLSDIPGYHIPADLMPQIAGGRQDCTTHYDEEADAFRVTVSRDTVDPYVALEYSSLGAVNASDYPYVVLRVRAESPEPSRLALYYYADRDFGASAQRVRQVTIQGGGAWQSYMVEMLGAPGWSGRLNGIRLDVFDSAETKKGATLQLGGITLCRSFEEAQRVASGGYLPEGSVRSYREYLGLIPPLPPLTEAPVEPDVPKPPEET
ncbi:MAG: phosphodiester glycosidase family protein, partial [Ruminococcaceae bacterium]|nr:phosphodiester glycosidase family protein [Oscillospiraceae bacterium]